MAQPTFTVEPRDLGERGPAKMITFEIPGGVTSPREAEESIATLPGPSVAGPHGVIFSGRGPVWLYCMLVHLAHPARWVAVMDPRLGAVVVASHTPGVRSGDVI